MSEEMTTRDKSLAAHEALLHYSRACGPADDLHSTLQDFLADIGHLAVALHQDPTQFLTSAVSGALEFMEQEEPFERQEDEDVQSTLLSSMGQHFIVSGRIPGAKFNRSAYIFVPEHDTRDAWEIFVETILYGGDNPNDLPEDWRDKDPSYEETGLDTWAYCNLCVEIPGPPVNEETMDDYE